MSDAMDGRRAVELGTEEVQRRLADGTAYLDVIIKGHWVDVKPNLITPYAKQYRCDQCERFAFRGNFCPNCGADMREGDVE